MYEIFHRHVGQNAVLFTTDGPYNRMVRCGKIPGVYTTIDYGSGVNVTDVYKQMRVVSPKVFTLIFTLLN